MAEDVSSLQYPSHQNFTAAKCGHAGFPTMTSDAFLLTRPWKVVSHNSSYTCASCGKVICQKYSAVIKKNNHRKIQKKRDIHYYILTKNIKKKINWIRQS